MANDRLKNIQSSNADLKEMLEPEPIPMFDKEATDVEFLLYGGDNRLYTVHRDNTIRLWTFSPYSADCHLYRVFIAENTVRSIHVVKLGKGDRFLTCEFNERGNLVNDWNVSDGSAVKIKGISSSYMGSQVRVCSVLYLSPHLLAVLVSDEGIVHTIDIWNTHTGACVHRQMYRAYLPVQNIYNIHGFLIIQPWSSMAEIIVWQVNDDSYNKTDTGTLLTAPPNNIAAYWCIISEDTGYILAGGTTLKIFYLNNSGRIKYLQSIDLAINGKLLDIIVLHSNVYRLLIVENSGVLIYNIDKDNYQCVKCNFKHRNKDILIRSDSGFTYRPYLFLPDNGLLLIQDTYANVFYKYQLPLEFYVPKPFAEIRKNARILHQGFDMSFLPAEMWILILSYSGYLYSKSLARKLAGTFFTKPLL